MEQYTKNSQLTGGPQLYSCKSYSVQYEKTALET